MSSNLLQRSTGSSSTPSHYQSIDNGDKASHHRNVASKAVNAIVEHILTFIKKLTAHRDEYKQFLSSEIMKCRQENECICNKFENVDKAELRKNFIAKLLQDEGNCSTAFFVFLLQCSEFKDDITDERMINIYTLFEQKNIINFFQDVDRRKVELFFSQSIDSIETILSQDAGTIKAFFDEKLEIIEYVMHQKKENIPGVCSAIASPQRNIAIACIENQKHKNCKLNGSIFSKLAESEKNIHILDQKELYCNGFAPIFFDESYKKQNSYVKSERFMNSPVANQGGALSNIDALFAPETSEEEIEQIMGNAAIVQFQDMNRNGFTKIIIGGKAIEMPLEPRKKSTHFIKELRKLPNGTGRLAFEAFCRSQYAQGECSRILPPPVAGKELQVFGDIMNYHPERYVQLTVNDDGSINIASDLMMNGDDYSREDFLGNASFAKEGIENMGMISDINILHDSYLILSTNIRYYPDGSAKPINGMASYRPFVDS